MILGLEHRLAFRYDGYISESFLELRVQPKTTAQQTVSAFSLAVGPPSRVYRYTDWNDNLVHHFNVTRYHERIEVVSRATVTTHPAGPPLAEVAETLPLAGPPYPLLDALRFGGPVRLTSALRRFHREARVPRRGRLGDLVRALGAHIHGRFTYRKDVTRFDSTTDDFLSLGAGVCQDFAHLMLGALRLHGVPCRYVSGYLHVEGRRAEPSQSHAWIEFWSPAHGWVAFDPTHAREIDERYVVVAHGRHYDDVPPNKGIYRGSAREALAAEVHTRPLGTRAPAPPQETVQAIELPVYTEVPERRREPEAVVAEAAAQQQQ